jgi:glucose-6-phosphate 1-epimerase
MDLSSLNQRFGISGVLKFEEAHGLTCLQVHSSHAAATVYLQGAHLTAWVPAGQHPVIFVSRESVYAAGKPIRGGVPVVFPWFAGDSKKDRIDGHPGPSHGFARIQDWTVTSTHNNGKEVLVNFELGPTEMSRSMGFDKFLLQMEMAFGATLRIKMTVINQDDKSLSFEDAFHSYYTVTDVHETTVSGLEPTSYIDKTDSFKVKPAAGTPITFTKTTDRIYNGTSAPLTIRDGAGKRRIVLHKTGSNSTVTWNPFDKLVDLGPWEWHEMVAVETANIGPDAITLKPGERHSLQVEVSVEKL